MIKVLLLLLAPMLAMAQMWPFPGPGSSIAGGGCTPTLGDYTYCSTYKMPTVSGSPGGTPILVEVTLGAGKIAQSNCSDVAFATDTTGGTLLKWGGRAQAFESCNSTTGFIQAWVYFPAPATDQQFVIFSSCTSNCSSSPGNAFPSSCLFAWHGSDGSTVSTSDESASNRSITTTGTITATTGKVGPGAASNGTSSSNYMDVGSNILQNASPATIQFWWKSNGAQSGSYNAMLGGGGSPDYLVQSRTGTTEQVRSVLNIGGTLYAAPSSPAYGVNDDAWHHVALVFNGTVLSVYADGSLRGSLNQSGTASIGGTGPRFFQNNQAGNPSFGQLDEMQSYNVALSADDIALRYSNQNNTSTWLTKVN